MLLTLYDMYNRGLSRQIIQVISTLTHLMETYVRQHVVCGLPYSVISSLVLPAGHKVAGETEP